MKDCEIVTYQRDEIDMSDHYLIKDFKKKFGLTIRAKTKKCVHFPCDLLHNEDYKLISDDPDRKTSDD